MTPAPQKRQMRAYPKVPELCERMQQFALQHRPHDRLPSIPELCQMFGTSSGTLNEVLGQLEEQEVLYRKAGRGIFVSPQLFRTKISILFASPWLSEPGPSPFWGMLLERFTRVANRRLQEKGEDYQLHLLQHDPGQEINLPKDFMRQVETKRIHGVLGVSLKLADADWLRAHEIPFVTFASYGRYAVGQDTDELMRLAFTRLIEQGCYRIGLWMFFRSERHVLLFQKLLKEANLPYHPELLQWVPQECPELDATQQGNLLARRAFSDPASEKPDGVIILSDMLTEGAIVALQSLGVQLGSELQIVTHGNKGTMLLFDILPGVTVIEYDPEEIAKVMFDLLDQARVPQDQGPEQHLVLVPPYYRKPASRIEEFEEITHGEEERGMWSKNRRE